MCGTHARVLCRSNHCFELSDGLKRRLKTSWRKRRLKTVNTFSASVGGTCCPRVYLRKAATVGRILVSDKTFNIPVVAIHCSNAQKVGFENPTYGKLQTFRRPQTPSENLLVQRPSEKLVSATVGRILVSDKTFNIPVVAIHCRNAQNVGFENPTYKVIPSITL